MESLVFKTQSERNIGKQRRSRRCGNYLNFGCTDFTCRYIQISAHKSGRDDFREDYKREQRYLKGEVTVYLSLVFILLISFAGAMLESASLQNVKNYRRADMTRAVLEGVAFGLRDSLEVARKLGIKIDRTKICGGGAKSPLWKKIIANVMNLKVDVLEVEEGPSMGGAMLAAVGCGAYPDVETIGKKMAHVVDTVEPEEELVAKYEEKYQKFKKLYPTLKPLF